MKKYKVVTWYFCFYASCTWLLLFVLMGSIHDHEYMLGDAGSEINSWCQLPMEHDPVRKEMYGVFLIQWIVAGIIFLRRKNYIFIVSMALVCAYATDALILKDMLCG